MANIYMLEAASLFLGDDDPSAGKHLQLDSLGLPKLEYQTVDHNGAGAAGEIALSMDTISKLEPSFKLAGFDEDSYRLFGIGTRDPQTFTARGVVRSKIDGNKVPAKAIIRGIIGSVDPGTFEMGNKFGHDHTITEVSRYSLTLGDKELFYWDYYTMTRRQLDVDELADARRILGLQ